MTPTDGRAPLQGPGQPLVGRLRRRLFQIWMTPSAIGPALAVAPLTALYLNAAFACFLHSRHFSARAHRARITVT